MINNLILSGGQIRGIGYIGVLKALEELEILNEINNICGISSGSIFALTYCLEFKSKDLKELVLKLNIDDLKETYCENIFNLVYNYGLDSGTKFERLIKIVLKKKLGKETANFTDLHNFNPNKNLIIVGSNLTNVQTEYFCLENTPEMEIWKAIRISISFPVIFDKVDYNNMIYVDGGLTDNFPIDYFENDIENTLGICVNSSKCLPEINNLHTYLLRIIYTLASQKQRQYCEKYKENTITINLKVDITSLEFDGKIKNYLINEGYNQFKLKLKEKKYIKNIFIIL